MLIGDIPARNAKYYPDKCAVIESNIRLTFAELDKRINRLANAILSLGLKRGDRVAVLFPNGYQYVELYFATAKAGTPIVPLNFRTGKQELVTILADCEPRILFFGEEYWPDVQTLLHGECKSIDTFVCIGNAYPDALSYEDLISASSDVAPVVTIDENDMAILGYTGGTTGFPKGVMTTHKNVIASCFQSSLELGLQPGNRLLSVAPLFHAGAAIGMIRFSFVGGTNVIMNSGNPEEILKYIQDYNITHSLLVPAIILRLLRFPGLSQYDFSSLRLIMYGTAPMPLEPLKEAMKLFNCDFAQIYGATEAFAAISILSPNDHKLDGKEEDQIPLTSGGRPVYGVQVKIVDENNEEVPLGQAGEIIAKGDNIMKGYWRRPELTEEVLRDGWYHTGDIGRMDGRSYIYVVDRKKDMIISGGENIYPKEIEAVLFKLPAVAECTVIGVPDETWGECVMAYVIPMTGMSITEEQIIEHCKLHLASYKKPRTVKFVRELPRSTAGKILKHQLREQYWKDRSRKV